MIHTICPECDGEKKIAVAKVFVSRHGGPARSRAVVETCKACKGRGSRHGFQPPV